MSRSKPHNPKRPWKLLTWPWASNAPPSVRSFATRQGAERAAEKITRRTSIELDPTTLTDEERTALMRELA